MDGILARGLAGEIVGEVAAGCEIGWRVVGHDAAFFVAKDHVHDPAQGVLDGPVGADHRADRSSQHHQRGDVEACLAGDLVADHAAKGVQWRELHIYVLRRDGLGPAAFEDDKSRKNFHLPEVTP